MTIHIPTWIDGELQPVEKLEAHQRGLRHKAISVFVLRDGRIAKRQRHSQRHKTTDQDFQNTHCRPLSGPRVASRYPKRGAITPA